jgi:hypothetical protein
MKQVFSTALLVLSLGLSSTALPQSRTEKVKAFLVAMKNWPKNHKDEIIKFAIELPINVAYAVIINIPIRLMDQLIGYLLYGEHIYREHRCSFWYRTPYYIVPQKWISFE